MLTFETGVALGQALSQLRDHEHRLGKIEQEVITIKSLATRGALLLLLWVGGLLINLPADRVGEVTAGFLKGLSK